jgi:RNA-directed DNA polymerase
MRQTIQLALALRTTGEGETQPMALQGDETVAATSQPERSTSWMPTMEDICHRQNLLDALRRVQANHGSPGMDGVTSQQLPGYLKEHWTTIRHQLLEGTSQPQPVRRVVIPKPTGGTRNLGIPTVLDRFIQQAVAQVLQRAWDGTFSKHRYGFRPGRSAHQAVAQAQAYIASGDTIVVDIDLENFFDRVNHDILMGVVADRVEDKRLRKLIRA